MDNDVQNECEYFQAKLASMMDYQEKWSAGEICLLCSALL